MTFEGGLDRMRGGHLTELGGERQLLLRRQLLIDEEQHQVLEPRGAHRVDNVRRE